MATRSQQKKEEMDEKARQGETVVPGGTGGKSVEAQQHLAEGPLFFPSCYFFLYIRAFFKILELRF